MLVLVCPLTRSFSDSGLTYYAPDTWNFWPWSIVEVPFWKQLIDAVVLELDVGNEWIDPKKIKKIARVKYSESLLNQKQIELLLFIAEYYFSLLHATLALFFPRNLREKIKKEKLDFKTSVITYDYKNNSKLTELQTEKFQEIINSTQKQTLFYGVTGSGKTSIYIEIIKKYLDEGKQSLLLVPEIILTSQIASKISATFWKDVLVLNSSVSEAKKTKMRMQIYSWEAKIIVWTRSSLFYPYKNLWVIVIDEEHDRSYKSDISPRYDAREIAFKISELTQVPVLLGSWTPSINTMYKAVKKDIWLVTLLEEYK